MKSGQLETLQMKGRVIIPASALEAFKTKKKAEPAEDQNQ